MDPETGSFPTNPPVEEHGVSLLDSPEQAADQRRRRERPAEVGRTLLITLGTICAGAGAALWITSRLSIVPAAFLAFGLLLLALGATLHLVLLRDRDRWPEGAHAWDEGIELLLHDGDLRASLWTDPKLALDVFVRPVRRTTGVERLLVWRMGSPVPPCDLSPEGFDRLMQVVVAQDLKLVEYSSGRKGREAKAFEIRARTDRSLAGLRAPPKDPAGSPA